MSDFLSIRNYPAFRRYFDAVHPLFWPVLYWQLKRAWLFLQKAKLTSVLLAITWWGGVRIVHCGDKIETEKQNPLSPTKPHWSDPVWSMDVPVTFLEAPCTLILPRFSGGYSGSAIAQQSPRIGINDSFPDTSLLSAAHPGESRDPDLRRAAMPSSLGPGLRRGERKEKNVSQKNRLAPAASARPY
ncbi:MAG: hypothetical protein RLO80_13755 [Hyphomonas sp.]